MNKAARFIFLLGLMSCAGMDQERYLASDELLEIPEDYLQACSSVGGELMQGDCKCLKSGKLVDPYENKCE